MRCDRLANHTIAEFLRGRLEFGVRRAFKVRVRTSGILARARKAANGEQKELNIGLRSLLVSYAELRLDRCHRFIFPRFDVA